MELPFERDGSFQGIVMSNPYDPLNETWNQRRGPLQAKLPLSGGCMAYISFKQRHLGSLLQDGPEKVRYATTN